MKKKSLIVVGVVVALALIAYVVTSFFLGSVVKAGVNTFGPKLTKTTVVLAGAQISPFTGSGTLQGLVVGNPEGWSSGHAFSLGKVYVKLKPMSIFGDHIEIEEINIEQPEFVYETKIISSNIKDLLKNIEEFTGSGGQAAATKSGQPIKFAVKKFRMSNATAKLGVGPAAIPVPLPPMTIENIGVSKGGVTPDELVGEVMQRVLTSIVSASGKALLNAGSTAGANATETVGDAAKKTGDGIKKLFGK